MVQNESRLLRQLVCALNTAGEHTSKDRASHPKEFLETNIPHGPRVQLQDCSELLGGGVLTSDLHPSRPDSLSPLLYAEGDSCLYMGRDESFEVSQGPF